jgi:CBS domain-containing membrane protein
MPRVTMVASDSKCRLALPGNESAEVGTRPFSDAVFGFMYCGVTFAVLGCVDETVKRTVGAGTPFMISAWASLAVLAFGTMDAPPLRLWNVVIATTCSAGIAIACVNALGPTWVARALSLSLSLVVMMRCGAVHPPAGAVALAAVDVPVFASLQYRYVLYPCLVGALFILTMSKACQATKRRYEFEFADIRDWIASRLSLAP